MQIKKMLCLLFLFNSICNLNAFSFQTRPSVESDIDVVYQLVYELAEFEGKDLSTLPVTKENLLKYGFGESPYFHIELAENENAVVGYALYSYGYSGHQGRPFLYIDDLYVKPSERNQGIGSCLLQLVAQRAKEVSCCRMEKEAYFHLAELSL